tara:strand:- start:1289 stop:1747 length:459 start_codon:yes stop_codon:yes gene_type:complete
MKSLTVAIKEGVNFDCQFQKWNVVDVIKLDTRNNLYNSSAIKNYTLNNVQSDYILWVDSDVTSDEIDSTYSRDWKLQALLDRPPYQVRGLLIATDIQKDYPWRNIPAQDYDMRLRLTWDNQPFRVLEGFCPNKVWNENATKIQNAYQKKLAL